MGTGGSSAGSANLEGNALDRLVYLGFILFALGVLQSRGTNWPLLLRQNKGLVLFYLFLGTSILWSDYPFVTFKRWFKDLGLVFVALVMLTSPSSLEALKAVFSRCAYILFPLSVVFIKYFPELGRAYGYSGEPQLIGITAQKNSLGEIVLVFGLILVSEMSNRVSQKLSNARKKHFLGTFITLLMGVWLLWISDSKTATICFLLGALVILSDKLPWLKTNPRRVIAVFFVAVPFFFALESLFGISNYLLGLIGRDATFTNRTEIWDALKLHPAGIWLGAGYLMYWDITGPIEVGGYLTTLKTAHNGYIEMYLDGGIVGVIVLIVFLLAIGRHVKFEFLKGSEFGRLQLAIFVTMLLYNLSESMYARLSPIWFSFLLVGLNASNCVKRYSPKAPILIAPSQ